MTEASLREIIGDPKRLDADLRKFRKEAKLLLSKHQDSSAKQPASSLQAA